MSHVEGRRLYLLPVWLGEAGGTEQLPPENIAIVCTLDLFFCEHEKTARRMLRRMVADVDLERIELHRLDKDTTPSEVEELIALITPARHGAVLSEAGMPGIADPGAALVRTAHRHGVEVVPLIGPSSLFLALAASGLNGQRFIFHGYLPVKSTERIAALKRCESDALRTGGAQLFIETPYRNEPLLKDMLDHCSPSTLLTIAIDLTQPGGTVVTRSIGAWRKQPPVLGKRPAVFIIGTAHP